MQQSCSVYEIRQNFSKKKLNKQYKNLDTQVDMLIYKRMLKGDIPIISLENKIKRALEKDKENINEGYGGLKVDIKMTWKELNHIFFKK